MFDLLLFIPAYSTFIGLACLLVAREFQKGNFRAAPALSRIGTLLAWGLTLAALLDIIESVSLWVVLGGPIDPKLLAIAKWCAIARFFIVFAGLAYMFSGLVYVGFSLATKVAGRGRVPASRV